MCYIYSSSSTVLWLFLARRACSLSLRFNGRFPGEPGLAGVYWRKGWWRWWWQLDYWSYKSCKAPVKSSPPTNQYPVILQAGCPSCHPTNSVKAPAGKNITFHGLAYPKLTWGLPTLSLTTSSSWLPWRRVAMPLINRLIPVNQGELPPCIPLSHVHNILSIWITSNRRRRALFCWMIGKYYERGYSECMEEDRLCGEGLVI